MNISYGSIKDTAAEGKECDFTELFLNNHTYHNYKCKLPALYLLSYDVGTYYVSYKPICRGHLEQFLDYWTKHENINYIEYFKDYYEKHRHTN